MKLAKAEGISLKEAWARVKGQPPTGGPDEELTAESGLRWN
jgi:hypothetical protein